MAFMGSIYLKTNKRLPSKKCSQVDKSVSTFSGHQIYRPCIRHKQARMPMCTIDLNPSNEDTDWVIVDVAIHCDESTLQENMSATVEQNAKSLVRVALRDAPAELSVVLCSDDEIQTINSKWRGVDKPTDVLSFPQDDPDGVVLGDVIISVNTAQRQADDANISFLDEIRILLVHGLLHLLGYDHEGAVEGDWLVVSYLFRYS